MAYKSLLLVCYALWLSMFLSQHAMADLDGLINIDEDDSRPEKESTVISKRVDSADGEDDDEGDYGSVMSDESGSGSGDETTTDPSIVDVSVVSPTGTLTTQIENDITESTSKSTEDPENFHTEEPTTEDNNVFGGGVNTGDVDAVKEDSTEESPNAAAQEQGEKDRVDKKVLRVLTTEVIAAVVVGAVCAVILIAFLVYRLRKRDEGSYALGDGGYKDTYKLQADTGKEAFV